MQINARGMTGAVISRLKHSDEISIPTASTVLHEGDYIQAVGSEESLNQLAVLVGEREEGELPLDKTQEIESLLLTKKDMINKQLGDLNLQKNFGCTVTRIRRSGIDLSPSPDLALKFGDKLMVVGEKEGLKGIARLLGNNAKKLSDTDFFPIAMGIVLGVLFGKINISFSESLSFSPGLTGGVLMVALVLSAIGKTGPITVSYTHLDVYKRQLLYCTLVRLLNLPALNPTVPPYRWSLCSEKRELRFKFHGSSDSRVMMLITPPIALEP